MTCSALYGPLVLNEAWSVLLTVKIVHGMMWVLPKHN